MDTKRNITKLSFIVLAQVGLFIMTYLTTIAIGAGLVCAAFYATIYGVPFFFEDIAPMLLRLGKLGIVAIIVCCIAVIGLWAFFAAIGIYLVKPLFIFPNKRKDLGKEIKPADSPKLFDMINETAKAAGVRAPKHVYVNHEVNACVFFNTGFWNIFLPVRKNLSIGLGLFESTNIEEVRSIIAHEFGHFAQNSMRVGSVLYVSNKVISDLVYRRDKLDSWLLRWCLEDGVWGFWGQATQSVVISIRQITENLFRKQQRNYMKLSRQMEYDADSVACKIVGTETFVSALCKTQKLSKSFDFYNRVLSSFANQNQIVENYWDGYTLTRPMMANINICLSSYDTKETIPEIEGSSSLVVIEEIWESHPSLEKRIDYARKLNLAGENLTSDIPSWELVDEGVSLAVSTEILDKFKQGHEHINTISEVEFSKELNEKIQNSVFPNEVEAFFDRVLVLDNDESIEINDNPLTDSSKRIVLDYEQAKRDKYLLTQLELGKIPVKHFFYNGVDYSIENVPVELHDKYLSELKAKVASMDLSIKHLAISKEPDGKYISAAYRAIEYAQTITERIRIDFLPVKNDIITELNAANISGEDDFNSLKEWLNSYEVALKDVLNSLKFKQIIPFITKEEHDHMLSFMDASRSFMNGINSDAINHMFAVTDWIMNVHNNICHAAKLYVIDTIMDKALPSSSFLKLWMDDINLYSNTEDTTIDDGKEHISINSVHGTLNLVVPTDEEIDTIYYEEWFRYHLWEKYESLEQGQRFDFDLVTTIPINSHDGNYTAVNSEDEQKFNAELSEYRKFVEAHFIDDDWSRISDAAEHGDIHANSRMAELYLSQHRYNMAYDAAMIGALGNDVCGIVLLGILESNKQDPNHVLATKLFKYAAVGGDNHALNNLGLRYAKGVGVLQDETRALQLFERAARQGNSFAQNNVGYMCLNGHGIEADPQRGLYWLYKAANQGYTDAVNTIWRYYKDIDNHDGYVDVVTKGAKQGIEECIAELNYIQSSTPSTTTDPFSLSSPTVKTDITRADDECPVCGKQISPDAKVCPHCHEIIRE